MSTAEILKELRHSELLTADGFDDAIIGLVEGAGRRAVVCYDYRKCVAILVAQGMEAEEAQEFLDFNTVGAYVGEYTPLFLHNWREEDGPETERQADHGAHACAGLPGV